MGARDIVRRAYIHAGVHEAFQLRTEDGEWKLDVFVVEEAIVRASLARQKLRPFIPQGAKEI